MCHGRSSAHHEARVDYFSGKSQMEFERRYTWRAAVLQLGAVTATQSSFTHGPLPLPSSSPPFFLSSLYLPLPSLPKGIDNYLM